MMKEAKEMDGDFYCYNCQGHFIASDELFYCKDCNKYLCKNCLHPRDSDYKAATVGDKLCKKCDQCFSYELPNGIECPEGYVFLIPIKCPICCLEKINYNYILKFCFKNSNTTEDIEKSKIQNIFKSYKDLEKFLNESR